MNFLMLEEVFVKVEGGLACDTFIMFPSVGLLMLNKMKGSAEALATLITLVGFMNSVGFLLSNKLRDKT